MTPAARAAEERMRDDPAGKRANEGSGEPMSHSCARTSTRGGPGTRSPRRTLRPLRSTPTPKLATFRRRPERSVPSNGGTWRVRRRPRPRTVIRRVLPVPPDRRPAAVRGPGVGSGGMAVWGVTQSAGPAPGSPFGLHTGNLASSSVGGCPSLAAPVSERRFLCIWNISFRTSRLALTRCRLQIGRR